MNSIKADNHQQSPKANLKEPFMYDPVISKQKKTNQPKRLFLPKPTKGDQFHWPGLIAPKYCLPEAPESSITEWIKIPKRPSFIKNSLVRDAPHDYGQFRDLNAPSPPDKKTTVENFYFDSLMERVAAEEAQMYVLQSDGKTRVRSIEKSRDKSVVSFHIARKAEGRRTSASQGSISKHH